MTKKAKARFILKKLDMLYSEVKKPLLHKDAYTLLVATILSAQCTDKRVNQVTPVLFAAAGNPAEMIRLGSKRIEKIVESCGLAPTKSKNIHLLSKILEEKFNGTVPQTFEELELLPGVGHKTASVVMCQAFGKPAFPVDTHIHRLMKRWGLSDGKNVVQTEKDCKRLFPQPTWHKVHLQIIFFGRQYCPARGHSNEKCPICSALTEKSVHQQKISPDE